MKEPHFFDELQVGDRWTSRARTITEADVVNFAGLTGDYDPLHMDHEYARQTAFGRPVVHGLLGLSFLAGLSSTCPAVHTAAFLSIRDWEFVRPTFIGDTVHVATEVIAVEPASRRHGRVTWRRQLINQAGNVVQEGVFETLVSTSLVAKNRRDRAAAQATPPQPHTIRVNARAAGSG